MRADTGGGPGDDEELTWMTGTNRHPNREPTRYERLAAQAAAAARLRALMTDPDVVALRVEKIRNQVDLLLSAAIYLGLAFTMSNVQAFGAQGAPTWSITWWSAWLLDPIPSLALLAILRAEKITARYQVALPAWAKRTKWLAFTSTYVMNTWTSWGLGERPLSWSGIVLHSVPPLVVLFAAETGPGLRDRLTEAVHRAQSEARAATTTADGIRRADTEPDNRTTTPQRRSAAGLATTATTTEQAGPAVEGQVVAAAETADSAMDEALTERHRAVDEQAGAEPEPAQPSGAPETPHPELSARPPNRRSSGSNGRVVESFPVVPMTSTNSRVLEVEGRLANGELHTGGSVGRLFGVSPRTGRRILHAAESRTKAAAGDHRS